ncbi:hypothetical protein SODALDRAFT_326667 [Sodiomyces alkalinus F11]|uniref:Tudor domain-containing protein n=1 Tax=Sodiomyces alkalinus (strain CBS 110278 / VKM F-3762 / F11) TaxID=1314773 RepID=A0A3N2Q773_SODAK|nr:hypothetical protein SODALDRAFT_326667 [Sodiomyces alkalinus F11]ROT42508.1 hypothetical protein SODALDRAFT_326667 [Sodiomyces alkalinus F11]
MASQLVSLEDDRRQYQEQLDVVLAGLKDDPDNAELKTLQAELNDMISLIDESIAELKPKQPQKPAPPASPASPAEAPAPVPSEPEKWSREKHPAFKKSAPVPEESQDAPLPVVNYKVNDNVLAKWVSGDKAFYPARIASITGSSTAPIYIVKFKSYDTTETLRAKDIRPVSNKRKADGTPASTGASTPATASQSTPPSVASPPVSGTLLAPGSGPTHSDNNGIVTSASASLYPEQQAKLEAQRNAADAAAKPPKTKKIKASKELEKGKNKWQEFSAKSKFAKSHKKDSMFRTPEGVHGRVGFTGSGQAMRKDPTRSRHVYQQSDDVE